MSQILEFSDLDLSREYSYSDYLKWHFKERVELFRGMIKKMSPAPSRLHQDVSGNLFFIIKKISEEKYCKVYSAPFDVRLPIPSAKKDTTVVQPDLCVVCDTSKLDEKGCNGAPDLIVEILSPGNSETDIKTKYSLYEEAGVKEYWMVQLVDKMVLVYTLIDGKYVGLKPVTSGEHITSKVFPSIKISINDIFEGL